jgi:hypothetical protein
MSVFIRVVTSVSEIEEIRGFWASSTGNRDSEIYTYLTFLKSHPETVRPHVLAVYRGGFLDAILVGRIDQTRLNCAFGYMRMGLPAKIMYFVYGALRGNASRDNCELLLDEILKSLSRHEADAAYLNYLRDDSELCKLARAKSKWLCRDYVLLHKDHYATDLPDSVEKFYAGLSSGSRWQAKNKQKKLLKEFGDDVVVRCFCEVAELEDLIRDVEQVSKNSYQRGLGFGFVDTPQTREQLRLKAEHGWLRAYILYVASRPWAYWIADINKETFGSDYLAYDAEFGKYSPGMVLILKVIEMLCAGNLEEITRIDFATGHAQYKEVLSNQQWHETSIYIFAPSIRGIGLNLTRNVVGGFDKAIKKALADTELLKKVKKRWRAIATPKQAVVR